MSARKRLIHLHACRSVTWLILKKFLQFDPTLKKIYWLTKSELQQKFSMKVAHAENFLVDINSIEIAATVSNYQRDEIQVVTIFDPYYPVLLKQIYDPPWVLYCKGDLSLLQWENKLSIVGTRDPSRNGLLSLEKIALPIVEAGWLIVSGLAVGIDARAHTVALNSNGKTIAVLGSGFNYIYPQCHIQLASTISKKHLLISEYPPNQKPEKWNFPIRNRIISGLSKGTLIVEARKKSGSLITADLALQEGRDVFAVPGSILDGRTEGTHWLIDQGAKLTKSSDDVLNEW